MAGEVTSLLLQQLATWLLRWLASWLGLAAANAAPWQRIYSHKGRQKIL
jgi:hypothetical protein